ncbi:MAG: aspartate/glutamate racemase family protein [Planctomycetota bacterium]|nr:aspartate/glutamate racemase family protein [Planctomycetota bacterium]
MVDVVRPGAAMALRTTDRAIAVIATEGTIKSGAYQRAIHACDPAREVLATACPLVVPMVEEGRELDDPVVLHVLADYLHTLQRVRPGALILGCTHYPLLAGPIAKLMGPDVPLVDSGYAAALEVQRRLCENSQLNGRPDGGGLRCYTTDNAERFRELGERFGGRTIDHVEAVGTDELSAAAS